MSSNTTFKRNLQQFSQSGWMIVAGLAGFKLLIHLLTATNYGFFMDELYFLASGQHLAWGYVDFPPLTAFLAWVVRGVFGDSMFGIHLLPALAGAGLVILTGLLVHELGGKAFAQAAACLGVVVTSVYLFMNTYLSMNSIEPLIWMGCIYLLIRIAKTGETRLWLAFGVLAGIGLLNKHTMLIFGFGATIGVLLTQARIRCWNRWFFLGGALAGLIFLPNLIWMIQHNFPHLQQLANIRFARRNVELDPLGYLGQQVLYQNPFTLPLWLGGLVYFFIHPTGRGYRFIGWTYLLALSLLLLADGRPYYLSPLYPVLLAGGAVWGESVLSGGRGKWLKPGFLSVLGISGLILGPFSLPILPPEVFIRYAKAVPFIQPRIENVYSGALPQLFALRFGWSEMVDAVAKVYHELSPEEQARTQILAGNYGEAGAIDLYGPARGLPNAFSGHLTYFYWGQERASEVSAGATVIVVGYSVVNMRPYFEKTEIAGYVSHPYAMPYENFPIYLCRGLKVPLSEVWRYLKNFG